MLTDPPRALRLSARDRPTPRLALRGTPRPNHRPLLERRCNHTDATARRTLLGPQSVARVVRRRKVLVVSRGVRAPLPHVWLGTSATETVHTNTHTHTHTDTHTHARMHTHVQNHTQRTHLLMVDLCEHARKHRDVGRQHTRAPRGNTHAGWGRRGLELHTPLDPKANRCVRMFRCVCKMLPACCKRSAACV